MEPESILEHLRMEAEHLFDARAELLRRVAGRGGAGRASAVIVPVVIRGEEIVRAAASTRRRGRSRRRARPRCSPTSPDAYETRGCAPRRRCARPSGRGSPISSSPRSKRSGGGSRSYLHDASVQSLAGIALMLDAGSNSIDAATSTRPGRSSARRSNGTGRRSARCATSRSTSSRWCYATRASSLQCALGEQIGLDRGDPGRPRRRAGIDALPEKAGGALPDHPRVGRRGGAARARADRRLGRPRRTARSSTLVRDDGRAERRRAIFENLQERARADGTIDVDQGDDGGTTVRLYLPIIKALIEPMPRRGPKEGEAPSSCSSSHLLCIWTPAGYGCDGPIFETRTVRPSISTCDRPREARRAAPGGRSRSASRQGGKTRCCRPSSARNPIHRLRRATAEDARGEPARVAAGEIPPASAPAARGRRDHHARVLARSGSRRSCT